MRAAVTQPIFSQSPWMSPVKTGETLVGRYEIQQLVGMGGSSWVYQARDSLVGEVMALKVLRPFLAQDPRLVGKFKQDVLLARKLVHPNVIRIYDIGEHEGLLFISMEFIEGRTLADLLAERRRFSAPEFFDVFRPFCSALSYVHSQQILHCDIKPTNLMFDANSVLRLMDFGIARRVAADQTQGLPLGTPAYTAPEVLQGRPATAASDIYAAGRMFYELLAGKKPSGQPPSGAPADLRQAVPGVPADLALLVAKCVEPDPDRRFSTVEDMARAAAGIDQRVVRRAWTKTLADLFAADPPPPPSLLPTFREAVERLAQVHAVKKFHRGLSPMTIRLGVSGRLDIETFDSPPAASEALGQPQYASPEMFGEGFGDDSGSRVASDIYILGFIFYEMALGRRLFRSEFAEVYQGEADLQWLSWHGNREAKARELRELLPGFPTPLSELIARMMSKNPGQRAVSFEEIVNDLARAQERSAPTMVMERPRKPPQAWSLAVKLAGLRSTVRAKLASAAKPPAAVRKPGPRRALPAGSFRGMAIGGAAAVLLIIAIVLAPRLRRGKPQASAAPPLVEVRTMPPGAMIRIDGRERGVSPLTGMQLSPGPHRVEAQREGYQPAATSVTANPGVLVTVELALQPLAQVVRIHTDLESGTVALDGRPAGELQDGQLVLENVAPGHHILNLAARHGEAALLFEIAPGTAPAIREPAQVKELAAVLVSNLGARAHVLSSFGPTQLLVDGQPAGQAGPAGLELSDLAPGEHELVFGEGNDEVRMLISSGPAPSLTAILKSDRNVGTLVVITGEDDVRVLLNNREVGRKTRHGQLRLSNLEVGEHTVGVLKDGYQNEPEQRVRIRKGDERKLEFRLRPIPIVASLVIRNAALAGAQVFLDGKLAGTVQADGSFSMANVPLGARTIGLRKDQFKPWTIQKHFSAGDIVQLSESDVALVSVLGTLRLQVPAPETLVTISQDGEAPRVTTETTLTLPEGPYTLTARAPGYGERTVTVVVIGGETRDVDLRLSPNKGAATAPGPGGRGGMADWEDAAGWTSKGDWTGWASKGDWNCRWGPRRGAGQVLYKITPPGSVIFTAQRRGGRLQWMANRTDEKNYALFEMDRTFFYGSRVVNGKAGKPHRVPHGMDAQNYYTLQVLIGPSGITHKLHDGEKWITLNEWKEPGWNPTEGKFGLLIREGVEVCISNFSFTAQPSGAVSSDAVSRGGKNTFFSQCCGGSQFRLGYGEGIAPSSFPRGGFMESLDAKKPSGDSGVLVERSVL